MLYSPLVTSLLVFSIWVSLLMSSSSSSVPAAAPILPPAAEDWGLGRKADHRAAAAAHKAVVVAVHKAVAHRRMGRRSGRAR